MNAIFEFVTREWNIIKHLTLRDISRDLELPETVIELSLSPIQLAYLAVNEPKNSEKKFSDNECFEALRQAQTFVFPLSAKSYANLINTGDVSGPSLPLINARFGSWTRACLLAGVEAGDAVRDNYDRQFTDLDILNYVRKFLFEQKDANWTMAQYVKWRDEECKEAPSMALIRNRIGSWPKARVEAIQINSKEFDLTEFGLAPDHEI